MSEIPEDFKEYYKGLEYRLDSLEKMSKKAGEERLDNYELLIGQAKQISEILNDLGIVMKEQAKDREQIAELKGWTENFTEDMAIKLNELKELENDGRAEWKNRGHRLEEVLRDHINAHKYIADQGSEIKIMDKWIEHLNTALEKLDANPTLGDGIPSDARYPATDRQPGGTGKDSGGEKHSVPLVVDSEKELNESDSADSKLPEPNCRCGHPKSWHSGLTDMCSCGCSQFIEEKTEPEKLPEEESVVEPILDLWGKNTITVVCPYCHQGYYLAPKAIEERVRDATRKELIEEFAQKLDQWLQGSDEEGIEFIIRLRDEYEGRVK